MTLARSSRVRGRGSVLVMGDLAPCDVILGGLERGTAEGRFFARPPLAPSQPSLPLLLEVEGRFLEEVLVPIDAPGDDAPLLRWKRMSNPRWSLG